MVHCGYEPTASLGIDSERGDMWKTLKFTFGPKPVRVSADGVNAFNGASSKPRVEARDQGRPAKLETAPV
jgi:hypothetical protein